MFPDWRNGGRGRGGNKGGDVGRGPGRGGGGGGVEASAGGSEPEGVSGDTRSLGVVGMMVGSS